MGGIVKEMGGVCERQILISIVRTISPKMCTSVLSVIRLAGITPLFAVQAWCHDLVDS